ncbi:winged helix-turn-helix domain-containing protein [Embleya sp. AB8]|uniref:winged helix-turn-helix domain-containing protein n=1 Tax=Embleya sp. AB8 TaxID=3156304 RepID=UPI003C708822
MTIRIHFTAEDLARVVLAGSQRLTMCETVLSLQLLQRRDRTVRFGGWRRRLGRLPAHLAPLGALIPADGPIPTFLTPSRPAASFRDEVEAVLSTPRQRLGTQLTAIATTRALPTWTRSLAAGDPHTLTQVTTALSEYYDLAIAPHARHIRDRLQADRTHRALTLASGGVGALLGTLHPTVHWNAPILELPAHQDRDFHLNGRGLVLCPHFFSGPIPHALLNETDTPTLVYPIPSDPDHFDPLSDPEGHFHKATNALTKLLGRTRAAVLQSIADTPGLTTSQLAHNLDISLASASQHITTLREASLLTTHRHRNALHHSPTTLGTTLLNNKA